MRRASNYAVRARRIFCDNKRVAPIDLVLSGKRSLEEWVEVLRAERERAELQAARPRARVQPRRQSAVDG
jgi:hypothetical protein